jgi:DegV family protein with EDD domain
MPPRVAIVTDSTACVPPVLAERFRIRTVQLQLKVGDHLDDEGRIAPATLIEALRSKTEVSTAPPDAGAFFWAYQDAIARGAEAIVSIHISSRLSQTCAAAKEAAAAVGAPVHVLDSGTAGMSLGYAALAAAQVAAGGGTARQVVAMAGVRIARSSELIHVETLEYLHRSGRIGGAAHLVGTALALKPLLTVRKGEVSPLDRTIGAERAVRKMVDRAVKVAGNQPVDLAVEHFGPDDRVPEIVTQLRKRLPNAQATMRVPVSAVIAAHVGPGALGITISPAISPAG